jgi:hypothetical protein
MHAQSSLLGRLLTTVGIVEMAVGAAAWVVVSRRLADEKIVVPGSARWLPNRTVRDPLTDGQMAEDDPKSRMALDASLIRSSLFTAILAFGMAATQVALGVVFVVIGRALVAPRLR